MIPCEKAAVLLSARMDGQLTREEEKALEDHLARCPECRAIACQLEQLRSAMTDLEDLPAPEGFAGRVMEHLGEQEKPAKVLPLFRRPQVRALTGLAACALLCVGLYGIEQHRSPQPAMLSMEGDPSASSPAAYQTAPVTTGEEPRLPADPGEPASSGGMEPGPGVSEREIGPEPNREKPAPKPGDSGRVDARSAESGYYNAVSRGDSGQVALHIPEGWRFEAVREEGRAGLRFWPEGREGAVTLYGCADPVGVCSTGLEEEQVQLPSGSTWTKSTYQGSRIWDLMVPCEPAGALLARTEPAVADWWQELGDQALAILDSAQLEKNP